MSVRLVGLLCFIFPFLLLASCGDDTQQQGEPQPVPEPDEPAIVIPDTENTAPVIAQEGGTATVSFTASADWTAEATAVTRALDWVSVQPTAGKAGDVTLTITTQPNKTYDERNAAIVLTCAGERTTFTVSQKQKDALLLSSDKVELDATGGDFTLALQTNVSVSYEIEPGADWLKPADASTKALEDLSFAFHAEENTDTESRQATITLSGNGLAETVTVFQAGTAPVLVLGQQEYIVGSTGETIAVELKSNTDYRVQLPAVDWIAEADTRALSAYTHYFVVALNDTYDARTAEIIFVAADGTLADTVWVTQVQQDAILLAQREYAFPAEGGTLRFSVQANVQPEVLCDADWLHPVETRGLTEHAFAYTVDENTGYDARQADLIVRDIHNPSLADTLTVRHAYRDALIVAQREYDIPAEGGTLDFHVQTNATLETVSSADWLTRLPDTRALRDEVLHFVVAANTDYDAREATVIIRSVNDSACADTVLVRQGYQNAIIVAQREYDVPGTGGTLDFTVQANVDVTATADVDWITQAPGTRGLVEKNLCFDIAPNEGTEVRQGTITLSGGGVTQTITVRQEAYEEPELVRVEYRTGYTWEEAHDNLPLLYYATVYRDRYYDNGEKITDTFVDAGHMASFSAGRNPERTGSYSPENGITLIYSEQTKDVSDQSLIVRSNLQVSNLNALSTEWIREEQDPAGNWDEYVVSKLYDSNSFISASNVPTNSNIERDYRPCGWYFSNCGFMRELNLDYQGSLTTYSGVCRYTFTLDIYDQFLVIDGRRIDFLEYRPDFHFNLLTKDILGGIQHTCECSFEFMGRDFYVAVINDIKEQEYDPNEVYYFGGDNMSFQEDETYLHLPIDYDGTFWEDGLSPAEHPITVKANRQPILSADEWITIESVEQGAKWDEGPVSLETYNWNIHWSVKTNIGEPRTGYIYMKDSKGEVKRKVEIYQGGINRWDLIGTIDVSDDCSSGWSPEGAYVGWDCQGTLTYHKANNSRLMPTVAGVDTSQWPGLSWHETADDVIFQITPNTGTQSRKAVLHLLFEDTVIDFPITLDGKVEQQ